MDAVNLNHSTKDIPVPSEKVYKIMMINSIESFIRNLTWKVIFFLNPSSKHSKETYDFKSLANPSYVADIEPIKADLIDMVKNIEFENKQNKFQNQLKAEKNAINSENKLIISADKTSNHYKVTPEDYETLVKQNVEKEYKKETAQNVKKINQAHKSVVKSLDLQDRVFQTMDRTCFITLKDHKPGF